MQSPSSSTSASSRTASNTKMLSSPNKTSSIKTKSTTVLNLGSPTTAVKDLETSLEIEKISKKISEHADALYRTWKSHGLAPTELLELYTVDAGVAAGAITDDKNTEDLQKLVNTFVNKDKEQRGVKTVKTKTISTKQEPAAPKVIEHKIQTTNKLATPSNSTLSSHSLSNSNKLATPSTSSGVKLATTNLLSNNIKLATPSSSNSTTLTAPLHQNIINNKLATPSSSIAALTPSTLKGNTILIESPSLQSPTAIKKSTQSPKSPNFLSKTSTAAIDMPDANTAKVTKLKTAKQGVGGAINDGGKSATKTQPSKQLDIDIDFNINLDLNLDVHKLTQQQTQNLQKIKELLQEPAKTPSTSITSSNITSSPATGTKIPSVTQEKMAGKSKEIKVKKSSIDSPKKLQTQNLEENKQNDELAAERKLTIETPQINKKIGNKLKLAEQAHDLNLNSSSPTIEAIIKKSKPQDNRDNAAALSTPTSSPTSQQLKKKLSPTGSITSNIGTTNNGAVTANGNVTIENQSEVGTLLNAQEEENLLAQNKENSIKLQKSTTKTTKSAKLKEKLEKADKLDKLEKLEKLEKALKESKETALSKILDSKETGNISRTAAIKSPASSSSPLHQLNIEVAVAQSESQNMETQRSDSTTIMPTPTKLKSTRPLSNGQEKSLKSPFLTRGSVAERVLMFEKCPDVRNSFLNIKRPDKADAPPKSLLKVKLHATPPPPPPEQNSIQKEYSRTKSVYIPRFYFPHGKPQPTIALERTLRGILSAFDTFPNNQVTKDELPRILKICNLPFYWRMPVMVFCQQGNSGLVERQRFVDFWKQMNIYCHDDASRFVYILSRGQRFRTYILPEDLAPLVQDVVDTHPGLAFLKEATEFHSRYVHTVIARIFYSVNRSWSGRISISELKKSDLLEILSLLEEEDDINQIMAFFSYEHFYVIYCKFWELDKDHDLLINQDDLARHSDHALSTRIVERIFSGCVTKNDNKKNPDDEPKMSYTDFVWFLLSEEDKRTPTAIEYWFRCMDVDGDGVLSMYELEYFYEEQQQRMESIGIESLPFEDCLCQMLDMIKPKRRDAITLGDLKNCKMTHVFFDTFFNLEKYLDHEQRDPFASQRDEYATDWERFAAQEYELLITEENE